MAPAAPKSPLNTSPIFLTPPSHHFLMSDKIYVLHRFICVAKTSRQEIEELASHSFRKTRQPAKSAKIYRILHFVQIHATHRLLEDLRCLAKFAPLAPETDCCGLVLFREMALQQ
jgi:hypothetical protein